MTGTLSPGPPVLRVVASIVLKFKKVKNMTVVLCRIFDNLHLFSALAPVGTQGMQPLAPTHPYFKKMNTRMIDIPRKMTTLPKTESFLALWTRKRSTRIMTRNVGTPITFLL